MRFHRLHDWLTWQEALHPVTIDLGLERVRRVWQAMSSSATRPAPLIITVAGTNGKGSTVAMLEAILNAAGYRVGAYSSPHLLRYNERVRVGGQEVTDAALCEAFACVDAARGEESLTYFEFGTLAALDIFFRAQLDILILEVGLGGRLDAVNILDADVAVITTIDLDHMQWLGENREQIAYEKAGIARPRRPIVCGDSAPPLSLQEYARRLAAPLYVLGQAYSYDHEQGRHWRWRGMGQQRSALPPPALPGEHQYRNAALVLMVLHLLQARYPVSQAAVRQGLTAVRLAGRLQVLDSQGRCLADVAHNPQAAQVLAQTLAAWPKSGRLHAVFAMLADKDIEAVVRHMAPVVDVWHVAGLEVKRAAPVVRLTEAVRRGAPHAMVYDYATVAQAYTQALDLAAENDRVLVFGSFYTVAAVMESLASTAEKIADVV